MSIFFDISPSVKTTKPKEESMAEKYTVILSRGSGRCSEVVESPNLTLEEALNYELGSWQYVAGISPATPEDDRLSPEDQRILWQKRHREMTAIVAFLDFQHKHGWKDAKKNWLEWLSNGKDGKHTALWEKEQLLATVQGL